MFIDASYPLYELVFMTKLSHTKDWIEAIRVLEEILLGIRTGK